MTDFLLPIVEGLSQCQSHQARALWLLVVPDAVVLRDVKSIRAVLDLADFGIGISCLEARYTALFLKKTASGDLPVEHRQHLEVCLSVLRAIAGGSVDNIGDLQ